jgi:hypothetical protein
MAGSIYNARTDQVNNKSSATPNQEALSTDLSILLVSHSRETTLHIQRRNGQSYVEPGSRDQKTKEKRDEEEKWIVIGHWSDEATLDHLKGLRREGRGDDETVVERRDVVFRQMLRRHSDGPSFLMPR